jgi:hypothetical protein
MNYENVYMTEKANSMKHSSVAAKLLSRKLKLLYIIQFTP